MWSRIPIVRLIIPFSAGVLSASVFDAGIKVMVIVLGILAAKLILGRILYSALFSYGSRWVYGLLIISFMFIYGFFLVERMDNRAFQKLDKVSDQEMFYLAKLDQAFEMRENSCRAILNIVAMRDSLSWQETDLKVMLYTEPDSSLLEINPGNYIIILATLKPPLPPANPGTFNYKQYLARQGIFHTTYLKKGKWQLSNLKDAANIFQFAISFRKTLLDKLLINGIDGKYFGISSALLLGEDSHLQADVREIYARAGAMHILCVSGLHVGVIFLVLNTLFGFLKRFRMGKSLLPVVLLSFIWIYALVTGLAPPVVRASCMISFIIVGNALGRQKNVYNSLAASAFLMLLFDPFLIYSAGFQLSYAAVIGIVWLQKPIYNLFYFRFQLPDKIWAITTVSIAAQLGTFPVVMYYFHQFPLYSLLTNLIVIPLSSLIIYAGFILLSLPSLSTAASAASWVLKTLILLLDEGVNFVESLPYGVAEGIHADLWMALMTGAMICFFCGYLIARRSILLFLGMLTMLAFSIYRGMDNYYKESQQAFIVYSVNRHSAYDIINGREHVFYSDSSLLQSPKKINYSIEPSWQIFGLSQAKIIQLPPFENQNEKRNRKHATGHMKKETYNLLQDTGQIIKSKHLRILVWQAPFPHCMAPREKLKLDYLILRGNCPFNVEDVYDWFDLGMIILDSSVPPWVEVPNRQDVWSVRERGAFIIMDYEL